MGWDLLKDLELVSMLMWGMRPTQGLRVGLNAYNVLPTREYRVGFTINGVKNCSRA